MLPSLEVGQLPISSSINEMYSDTFSDVYLPSLNTLINTTNNNDDNDDSKKGVMIFKGGESEAIKRLNTWMFDEDNLKDYFDIRNGMLGSTYSSKLSPWLALGCISPRYIYEAVKRYEQGRVANKSTYWLIFELIWRDFYRALCGKYNNKIFQIGGAHSISKQWNKNEEYIRRWKDGMTGYPLVDANMRELKNTGWMSNRGRQNVASFLVLDLQVDWRIGADHFESYLIDHDVYSNYGNWNAAAGLTGGRVNKFNIAKQSKDYDANGAYLRHWLPELKHVPAPLIHEPWRLTESEQEKYQVKIGEDYPQPIRISNNNNDNHSTVFKGSSSNNKNSKSSSNNNSNNNNGGKSSGGGSSNNGVKRGRRDGAPRVQHF